MLEGRSPDGKTLEGRMPAVRLRDGSGVDSTGPLYPVPDGPGFCAGACGTGSLVLDGTLKIVALSMIVFTPTMIGPLDVLDVEAVAFADALAGGVGGTLGGA